MPGFDGTGPMGVGPTTGRGLGPCNNANSGRPAYGRGRGGGMGRGMGRGRGFGLRMGNVGQPRVDQVQVKNQVEVKQQAENLED